MAALKQKWKQVVCAIRGHTWTTERVACATDSTKIETRTYCKRCGARYHKYKH